MTERSQRTSIEASSNDPLISIPLEENDRQLVSYFTDETAADAYTKKRRPRDGRDLAGIWKVIDPDLDWDELADELDRIRHESKPTPPIDLDP